MTRTQWVHRSFVDDQDDDDPERPPVSSLASRSTYGHDESVESSVSYPTNVNTAILLANRTTNVFTLTAAWRPYVLHAWLVTGPARRPELAADHMTWTRHPSATRMMSAVDHHRRRDIIRMSNRKPNNLEKKINLNAWPNTTYTSRKQIKLSTDQTLISKRYKQNFSK